MVLRFKASLAVLAIMMMLLPTLIVFSDGAGAGTVIFDATNLGDANVEKNAGNTNFGSQGWMNIGGDGIGAYAGYLKFNVSNIPSSASITSALLKLYKYSGNTVNTLNVYRVTASWSEGTITYNNRPNADATVCGTFSITATHQYYTANVTSLVQSWVNGTYQNEGLRAGNFGEAYAWVFYSKENADNRPILNITYTTTPPPVAAFSGTPTSGLQPLNVTFTDASTNAPTNWTWSFGDGTTSYAQNPSHIYSTAGTFTVSLKAKNSAGEDYENKTGYITVNAPPVITSVPKTEGQYGFSFLYHATSNEDSIVTWSMDTSSNDLNIDSATGLVNGKIRDLIGFWINVTADDGARGTDSLNWTVNVTFGAMNPHITIYTNESARLRMAFEYAIEDQPGVVLSVTWNFGDGLGSRDAKPVHTYAAQGDYLVTLSMWLINGDIAYSQKQLTVGDPIENATIPELIDWWATWYGMATAFTVIGGLVLAVGYSQYQHKKSRKLSFAALLVICMGVAMTLYLILFGGFW